MVNIDMDKVDKETNKNITCPMSISNSWDGLMTCLKEKCAWWHIDAYDSDFTQCAILIIAKALMVKVE